MTWELEQDWTREEGVLLEFLLEVCRPVLQILTLFQTKKFRGDSYTHAYERGVDARRKFWIKPLKETDLGVAKAFFDP